MNNNKVLVPVICPQCNAQLDLDSNLEVAFCTYCGTKIIIKDAVQEVKIVGTPTLDNYLKLGDRSYDNGEFEEALSNYKRVLEIDPDNWKAIYRYGYCQAFTSNIAQFNIVAATNGIKEAIKIIEKDKNNVIEICKNKIEMSMEFFPIFNTYYSFTVNHYNRSNQDQYMDRLYIIRESLMYVTLTLLNEEIVKIVPKIDDGDITLLRINYLKFVQLIDSAMCKIIKSWIGSPVRGGERDMKLRQMLLEEFDFCTAEIKKIEPNYVPQERIE